MPLGKPKHKRSCEFCANPFTPSNSIHKFCCPRCNILANVDHVPSPNYVDGDCWQWIAGLKGNGYGQINVDGHIFSVHKLAYKIFIGPIPKHHSYHGMCVCHDCDNKLCVNPDHLFLSDQPGNIADAVKKNRMHPGEKHGMSKLTEEQVKKILASELSNTEIATKYGVTQSCISRIRSGDRWQHVKPTHS